MSGNCRLADLEQRFSRWSKQTRMPIRKHFAKPHDLEIDARDPKCSVIETAHYFACMKRKIEFRPRTLQPDLIEVGPVNAGAAVRILDTNKLCIWIRVSKRSCDADTGLRICA